MKDFDCHFGEIRNGIVGLSEIGNVAACHLQNIPGIRSDTILDEFIVMPNHLHCIIELTGKTFSIENSNRYARPVEGSISVIINQYKGSVKKWCNANGFNDFKWQGRFYDRVIRDNKAYWAIKNYIINNPANWKSDQFRKDLLQANPANSWKANP